MAERQLARVDEHTASLATADQFIGREKIELLKRTICQGATDDEFALFMAQVQRTRLDPFARQIHAVKRWNGQLKREVMSIQVGIDGFRLLAERTGVYEGQIGPYWCGPDGEWRDVWLAPEAPAAARVGVYKRGFKEPIFAVALWREYVQTNREGQPIAMWAKMPALMLAKCFDGHTEVLTDRGFQRFSDVTGRVLQVSTDGLAATDATPFAQDWSGDMVTLESDDLNFSVTPNHDMVTTDGKIEAAALYERARSRAAVWIPRSVRSDRSDAPITDQQIMLAAAYLADGYDRPGETFVISVSRERKIAALRSMGGFIHEHERRARGSRAITPQRVITSTRDKRVFSYAFRSIDALCEKGKRVKSAALLTLSQRQARLLVDTLIEFDGHEHKRSGVRRFYSSRIDHIEAFETAAIAAGYAVSPRRARYSDISRKPNYHVTISDRDAIPVLRWGRSYHNVDGNGSRKHTGLEITQNIDGKVWCVTVPSGVIVVRRNGFSMLCGNCAESAALRRAFPSEMSGLYSDDDLAQAGPAKTFAGEVIDADTGEVLEATARPSTTPRTAPRTAPRTTPPAPSTATVSTPAAPPVAADAPMTEETRRALYDAGRDKLGWGADEVYALISATYNVADVWQLTDKQARALTLLFTGNPDKARAKLAEIQGTQDGNGDLIAELVRIAAEKGVSEDQLLLVAWRKFGVQALAALTETQLDAIDTVLQMDESKLADLVLDAEDHARQAQATQKAK